jgi:hypothetical protein
MLEKETRVFKSQDKKSPTILLFFLMVRWLVGFLCIKNPLPLKTSNLKAKVLGCTSQSSKHVGFPTQPFGTQ